MKNFNFFEKLWEHGRTLRRVGLVLVMCLITITQAWGWSGIRLCGDYTGSYTTYTETWTFGDEANKYWDVYHSGGDKYWRIKLDYFNHEAGPNTDKYVLNVGTTGYKVVNTNSKAFKTTSAAGILRIQTSQNHDAGSDERPNIWVTRPTVKFKHPWNGGEWTLKNATDNYDGTYTLEEKYGGTAYFNAGPNDADKVAKTTTNIHGSLSTGVDCLFKWEPGNGTYATDYRYTGGEEENRGTFHIYRLYTISFNANEGSGSAPSPITNAPHGVSTQLPGNTGNLRKTSAKFIGWNTRSDGKGTHYAANGSISVTSNTTLYAEWEDGDVWCVKGGGGDGALGSWDDNNQLSYVSANALIWTKTLAKSQSYEFKMYNKTTGTWYANGGSITGTTTSYNANNTSGGNISFSTSTSDAGTYTFVWNASTKQLSVYYPGDAAKIYYQTNKYFYLDGATNATWRADSYDARFWFKIGGDDLNDGDRCTYSNALGVNYMYYSKSPNVDYIDGIQIDRRNPGDPSASSSWNVSEYKYAVSRTNTEHNCLIVNGANWDNALLSWGYYRPPMKSAVLNIDEENTRIYGGDGGSSTPYLVATSSSIYVSATSESTVPDDNMIAHYQFKEAGSNVGSKSATSTYTYTASSSSGTKEALTVEASNYYGSDYGTLAESPVVYYEARTPYRVTHTLGGVSTTAGRTGDAAVVENTHYEATFKADDGYDLPSTIVVKFGGTAKTVDVDYTWNSTTGNLSIPVDKINGNVEIIIKGTGNIFYVNTGADAGSAPSDATTYAYDDDVTVKDNSGLMTKDGKVFAGWTDGVNIYIPGKISGDSLETFKFRGDVTLSPVWKDGSYLFDLVGSSTNGTLNTTDFTVTSSVENTARTINGVCFSKSSNKFKGTSGVKSTNNNADRYMVYDTKTTETTVRVYAMNVTSSAKKLIYNVIQEGVSISNDTEVSIGASEGKVIVISANSTKGARVILSTDDNSNMRIAQIIAAESGTALPAIGEKGFELTFPGRVTNKVPLKTMTIASADNLTFGTSNTFTSKNKDAYMSFTVGAATQLRVTTSNAYGVYVCTDRSNPTTTGEEKGTVAGTYKFNLKTATTYYVFGSNGSNKTNISKIAFSGKPQITYDGNGGSGSMSPNYFTAASCTFTHATLNFIGWNTKANGSGTPYAVGADITDTVKLYAQWGYTVTYNLHGHGEAIDSEGYTSGSKITKPTDPYEAGYEFDGWYKESTYENEWNFASDVVSANTTLHAKWTKVYATTKDFSTSATQGTVPNQKTITGSYASYTPFRVDNFFFGATNLCFETGNASEKYNGWKFQYSGSTIKFFVENDCSVAVAMGANAGCSIKYTPIDGSETTENLSTSDNQTTTKDVKGGTMVTLTTTSGSTVTLKSITITDKASCSAPTSPSISGTTDYMAGNTISLMASATGTSGSTTYTWYKGADWATASADPSVGSGATFTKASCVVGDAGTYWCNISNGTGCEVQVSKAITVSAAPTVGTFSPASGSTVKSGTTVTVTGSTGGSTVYYQWSSSSSAPTAATIVSSGTAGTSGAATVTTSGISSSATYLYVVAKKDGVNSAVSSASYTIDDTAPTLSSSVPANSATNVNTSGTIVLTFSEAIASVDETKFTLTNATKGAVAIDGSDNTKVNIAYSEASNSTTVTLATAVGAVTDAVGNSSAALGNISFTTKAAAASLTAISANTLYQAADMATITLNGTETAWNAGLSSNNLFKTYGGSGETAKGNTITQTTVSGRNFTSKAYIMEANNTSSSDDPTKGAIEFITPSKAGKLLVYTVDGSDSKLSIKKQGASSSTTTNATCKTVDVEANTHYFINGASGSRGIYGIYYDKLPEFVSSSPASGAEDVSVSGTIVLTFDESIESVDDSKFSLTGATIGVVEIDGEDDTKVNVAYSDAAGEAIVTLSVAANAVTDAVGNKNAALSSISFTTEAAAPAPAASCITWEGTPSSWTGDASPYTMTVSTNLVLKAVGKKWSINSSTNNSNVAGVWQENSADHIETVIAIDDHAVGKYLQGSFADGSVIQSLTIGAANNSGTAGTNNNYVVMFSATENFATVLADGSGNKAQVVSAPSYKDTYNASNLEKSITVPTGAKFFRIYRKIVGAGDSPWTIGDWDVPSDMGSSAKFRIFKIEACPAGASCTNPTIEWDNTPADGLAGGTMTASVTSNYPAGVTYSSSDATVASVNASTGVISYLKAGSATITATVEGDGTTYCNMATDPSVSQAITVTAVATGITVTPSTIDVQVGGTADLEAALTPADAANETVTWTSEYTANATVALADEDEDKTAVVTGVALRPGGTSFKIYAKTSRLTANSWYATVRVYKGVTYNATTNGGTCATASAKYYGDAALVLPAATRTGYTFNGWYTTASGDGTKIGEAGDEYTPSANSVTLYARFTENVETYAITYELNGGSHGSNHPATGTPDAAHELSAPTRSGYTFAGWSVSPVVSGAKCGTTSSPTTDITDASTLAQNGTSSVYFKNLAAANGAVTITAHWTQDCETSGGGGGSTTLFAWTKGDGAKIESDETSLNGNDMGNMSTGTSIVARKLGTNDINNSANGYKLGNNDVAIEIQGTSNFAVGDVVTITGRSGNSNSDSRFFVVAPTTVGNVTSGNFETSDTVCTNSFVNDNSDGEYSVILKSAQAGSKIRIFRIPGKSMLVKAITVTRSGSGGEEIPCHHVIYHANGAERGAVEDAVRYVEGATVTVKPNGFTKAGETFRGWNTADDGTGTFYYPEDNEHNTFPMGTADVNLYAVWGTAAPRVYALNGSAYRCTGDAESTITLAGSETDVSYQLKKDGVADGYPVTGTGSALTWSRTAWGTYTVVATRSAVSSTMSGEVVLSDYPLTVTENLNGGTVAQDGAFTLSAKVSVHADNSASYTYQWFSNDAANYDSPTSLGDATAMAASTGTQQFDYNPSTAEGGTMYYFCEFKSPCNTVFRTRVVSVKVTTATTTLTWNRDDAGDDFEDLPQGGKHTITVTSNSGVAPSLEVAGTDVELTDVEQDAGTATTTATLVLGASAADVVLTAEVSANGDYAEKSEDKEVIVKECSSGSETVLLSAYLSAYGTFTKDEGSGTATISNPGSDTHVTCSEKNYYKMVNGSTYYTFTLGGTEKFQAGDRIIFDVASSDQGNEKDFEIGLKASTSGSELHAVSTTLTTCEEVTFTIPVGSGLINGNTVIITRKSSENRVYGISIVRGGGSGSSADVASGIEWIIAPDPAITRSISNDPFTYAVRATTPSMGTITYESSDENVATVDANGRVTIKATGETTISAQQEAIGCYVASNTLSYSLTVESCTGEKEPVITYAGTVICPVGSQRLTATNYEEGATIQWYKDGVEIDGEDEATYDATEAGTYTVVAHNRCYSESSNSVTLTKMSETVDVKTYADEFTIKSERPYNFRLFEIEDGATMTVQSREGIDEENSVVTQSGNIISIRDTAPTIDATGNATVVIRISRTGCSDTYVDKTVTIHKIPATAKPTIAWIATGTKGDKEDVVADESNNVDLYKELEKYYTVTARNCYWTTSEAELVKEYSQYDLIVLTDYPNSQTAPSGKGAGKSYTNAIGLLKDHIPMLTFEAYVAQCPNWEIPSNPQNTSNTQNDITLLCNADEIFGTSGKFGAGSAISVSTVGSGQALQGFLPTDAPFVFIGSITDDATTYIACCERQVNPAARMMIFGLNANTMNNLTSDGKEMVRGFINYLMISDAARIPDCSVIFNGGAGPGDQNWNTAANWEGGTRPGKYASVRIDKPCVVSGNYVAEAGYLKIHTSTNESTYPYTGKLTIASDGVMAIDGTITRVEDNRYTLHLQTRPEDLIIQSDETSQGALIFDNDEGTTQARVEMYTKAYYDGAKDHWQYVAVPLASANRWSLGSWTYQHDNVSGAWDYYVDYFSPFQAIALAQDNKTTHVFEGALASTQTQKIAMPATNAIEGTSLIGNSWTAPIQIVNFEESDFGGATASIFIYETGYDPDGGAQDASGNAAAGERAAGYWYEIPVFGAATLVTNGSWAGMKVIPAMQAFEVKNTSGSATTFTMNYDRLVRTATNDMNEAMRAPRRMNTSYGIPTMRLTLSDGEIRNDVYLISGEQFSEGFDNGWDGGYVGGKNCSQLYALSPIGNLSMSAQPEMEGTVLGFAAGSKTEFTITFHYTGEEKLYLNDMEAHQSTLISGENEYTFTAESGEKGDRFVIGEQLFGAPGIATGVTDLDAEATEAQKIIYNDKLYIIRGGKVFSADGQLVK